MTTPTAQSECFAAIGEALELADKIKAAIYHQKIAWEVDSSEINYGHVGDMLHTKHTLAGLGEFLRIR